MIKKSLFLSTLAVLSVLTVNQSLALGPLKNNLKLGSQKKFSEEQAAPLTREDVQNFRKSRDQIHLEQEEPEEPIFKNYVKPFSATPYYDFFDAFLLGLKLETFFSGSDACISALVYAVDDYAYLKNNVTDYNSHAWEAPIMNFSKAIAGNFSNSIVYCEKMTENIITYNVQRFAKFNNNVSDFILSFLFNLMGRALQFKSIFDAINDNLKNQYYVDIANQYGRMVRIIFDFEPEVASSLLSAGLAGYGMNSTEWEGVLQAGNNPNTYDSDVEKQNFKIRQIIDSKVSNFKKGMNNIHQTVVVPDFDKARKIIDNIHSFVVVPEPVWSKPGFNSLNGDVIDLLNGVVKGGVGVLPIDSMIAFCQKNASGINTQASLVKTNWQSSKYSDSAASTRTFLRMSNAILFNCFYTVRNPVKAAQYNREFTTGVIAWNLLFNLGFMYTDVKDVIVFFYQVVGTPDTRKWETFGTKIGDFFIRFIYSKYIEKTYYKF